MASTKVPSISTVKLTRKLCEANDFIGFATVSFGCVLKLKELFPRLYKNLQE
jgi:hypothetical protein